MNIQQLALIVKFRWALFGQLVLRGSGFHGGVRQIVGAQTSNTEWNRLDRRHFPDVL
jgi:hypothetical protein